MPTHPHKQPTLSAVRFLVKGLVIQVTAVIKKGFNDSLQSLQPACTAPSHVNCTEKLMKDHKIWTFADDLVKIRW